MSKNGYYLSLVETGSSKLQKTSAAPNGLSSSKKHGRQHNLIN